MLFTEKKRTLLTFYTKTGISYSLQLEFFSNFYCDNKLLNYYYPNMILSTLLRISCSQFTSLGKLKRIWECCASAFHTKKQIFLLYLTISFLSYYTQRCLEMLNNIYIYILKSYNTDGIHAVFWLSYNYCLNKNICFNSLKVYQPEWKAKKKLQEKYLRGKSSISIRVASF